MGFPSIAQPEFQKLATDRFLTETIAKGRPGRRMPGWNKEGGLGKEEIAAVVTHLRAMAGVPARVEEDRWKAAAEPMTGEPLYAASCAGCHGGKGQGGKGPALANRVLLEAASDGFLRDTIAKGRPGSVMPAFSEPSTVHRTLTPSDIESIVAYLRSWQGEMKQ
ncbi:MAG: cytochrome c [Acidobacteria bacterium]|nr:cytochrome c [Acidobacteriota bacterium]